MSKDNKLQLLSPLFLKYQADFEKNPRSRVFAPLAEAYRKLGMTDKAMEILSQGIRFHPTYVMGYLGLAFCYYDIKQFNLAYLTLRPLTEANRDNLRLQKLFADVCLELGRQEEALETLKYLLFINPRDKAVAEQVVNLEREVENRYKPQHKPIIIPEKDLTSEEASVKASRFNLEKLDQPRESESNDFDDWMAIDLSHEKNAAQSEASKANNETVLSFDQWNLKKTNQIHSESTEPEKKINDIREYTLSPNVVPEPKNERPEEKPITLDLSSEKDHDDAPLVTHTLVDLYCGQGHIEKALEVLEKILSLNPNDQKTIKKIKEIQALVQPMEQYEEEYVLEAAVNNEQHIEDENTKETPEYLQPQQLHQISPPQAQLTELEEVSEEDGRRHLMSLIDEKLGPIEIEEDSSRREAIAQIEEKLTLFLKKIQKRALDYQGRV